MGEDRKERLDSNLNVLSRDCRCYSDGLAGNTICQTPLSVPPVKARPVSIMSGETYLKNVSGKPTTPHPNNSSPWLDVSAGKFNHRGRALTAMTTVLTKTDLTQNNKWNEEPAPSEAIYPR